MTISTSPDQTRARHEHGQAAASRSGVAVSIRSVRKHFGQVKALDDVSLDVAAGEFVSVLGPSGSGKTTLLSVIAGFTRLDNGHILFGERDVTLVPPHKRELGLVFQNYALFPHMSVAENIGFPLMARGVAGGAAVERVRWALDLVQLAGYEERRISQLSGGQKQRVALARAVVFEPKLILMDEPLSALDKRLRETMQIELRRLHRRLGATTIYVTHDQREALTMSDRVAVMHQGRLVQIDTPQNLYHDPVDAFVADFVGESTLVTVAAEDDHHVRVGDRVLRTARPVPRGTALLLALHAEKLISVHAAPASVNRLAGHVRDVVFQGESVRIDVELPNGKIVSMRQACHHGTLSVMPAIGDLLEMGLHPQDTIVVPAEGVAR